MQAWRIIKAAFWPVSAAATWVGIAYGPQDISDLPEALAAWLPLMEWVTRENLLILYSFVLTAYVCLRDAIPQAMRWWQGKISPIAVVGEAIFPISRPVHFAAEPSEDGVYRQHSAVRVLNCSKSGEALKNVQASAFFMGTKHKCYTFDGDLTFDLRHGDIVDFSIGSFYTRSIKYFDAHKECLDESQAFGILQNLRFGHKAFLLPSAPGKMGTSLVFHLGRPDVWRYQVVLSADGVRARVLNIAVRKAEDGDLMTTIESIGPFK